MFLASRGIAPGKQTKAPQDVLPVTATRARTIDAIINNYTTSWKLLLYLFCHTKETNSINYSYFSESYCFSRQAEEVNVK